MSKRVSKESRVRGCGGAILGVTCPEVAYGGPVDR